VLLAQKVTKTVKTTHEQQLYELKSDAFVVIHHFAAFWSRRFLKLGHLNWIAAFARITLRLKMSILYDEKEIPYIDLGEGYKIRLEFEDLIEDVYIEKAKNELRETPEVVKAAVEELRALIKGKNARTF
jgi:hypothetical protein